MKVVLERRRREYGGRGRSSWVDFIFYRRVFSRVSFRLLFRIRILDLVKEISGFNIFIFF